MTAAVYLIKCALSAGSPLQAKMTHPFTQDMHKVWNYLGIWEILLFNF